MGSLAGRNGVGEGLFVCVFSMSSQLQKCQNVKTVITVAEIRALFFMTTLLHTVTLTVAASPDHKLMCSPEI